MNDALTELQRTWHAEIPISAHMGIQVDGFEAGALQVSAPLTPNINVHGTAFAGSLYAVGALTGWGRTWLWLRARDRAGAIVIADARIAYTAPVEGRLVAVCRAPDEALAQAESRLASRGRCRLELTVEVFADRVTGTPAASLHGNYAIRV